MTCRICLSDESPETFVSPCRCVGTSSYIHEECLTTYLSYYPDRVCRVCLTQIDNPADSMLSYLTLGLLGASITYSDVGHWTKFAMAAALMGMAVYYSKKRLFNDAVAAFLLVLYLTFVRETYPDAIRIFLLALYLTSLVFVISATKRGVLFVCLATPLCVVLFEITVGLDAMATAVSLCLLFLVWYAWIRSTVRNGILPT
jgi:hypothetical protein